MDGQNKVTGVVLAGGLARRMGQQDKGLLLFKQRPLVSYAVAAMLPLVDELLISANRNQDAYRQFGYSVIGDASQTFDGPLAGILAAMLAAKNPVLLIAPCDSPLIETAHLQRLLLALNAGVDVAMADDGERLHPIFLAVKIKLQASLQSYLLNGQRKLQTWLLQQRCVKVDFSDQLQIFTNINTPQELDALEQAAANRVF